MVRGRSREGCVSTTKTIARSARSDKKGKEEKIVWNLGWRKYHAADFKKREHDSQTSRPEGKEESPEIEFKGGGENKLAKKKNTRKRHLGRLNSRGEGP